MLIALEDIDNVIALIKKSADSGAAKVSLMEKYKLDEIQAKSILAMRLSSLAHMEKVELENEKKELVDKIADIEDVISNKARQLSMIKDRLSAIVKKYGDARRTELTHIELKPEEKEIAEVIPEDVVVVATTTGTIKKVPKASFKVQRRGGKGIKAKGDPVLDIIKTNTVDTLMFFTDKGKMYRTIVDNVPTGTNATKGTLISDIVKIADDEKVIAVTSLHRTSMPKYAIFITKNGLFKKTYLEEYMKTKRNAGIAAMTVREGDSVVDIIFMDEEDMVIITKDGMSIRFTTSDINSVGRIAQGVKAIKLNDGDEVIAALPVHKETDSVAVFSENGVGKKTSLKEYPVQGRGGKGTITYKPNASSGHLVSAKMISDEDNLLIIGNYSSICISAKEIPEIGKTGVGNTLLKNNRITSVEKI